MSAAATLDLNVRSLNEIAAQLRRDANAAAVDAKAFLQRYPGQRQALALLVSAHRLVGDVAGARAVLAHMADVQPGLAAVHYELGLLLADQGDPEGATAALSRAVELEPDHAQAWRALGDVRATSRNNIGANQAYGRCLELTAARLERVETDARGHPDSVSRAERLLRGRLGRDPTDLAALALLAQVCIRQGRSGDSEKPLRRALELAPKFEAATKLAAALAGNQPR